MNTYTWYQTLIKPFWSPPAWLFGPVWTALYAIIAVSFWYGVLQSAKPIDSDSMTDFPITSTIEECQNKTSEECWVWIEDRLQKYQNLKKQSIR